jgi:hypothetical protein
MALTLKDLHAINQLLKENKKELSQEIDQRLSNLPTKEEFFSRMDQIASELQTTRQEQIVQAEQLRRHEDNTQLHLRVA